MVLGTDLLTVLTREGNGNLRDMVGMIKCKFLCKCCFHFKILVIYNMNLLHVSI